MEMRCINCYQEIPEGSRFCPHCGAQQPLSGQNPDADTYAEFSAPQDNRNVQPDTEQQENRQEEPHYGQYYAPQGGRPDVQQNAQYRDQNSTQYQYAQYTREEPVNWIPYLILSIISTVCCCIPLGIVAIFYTVKINSAVSAGDAEAAGHAAKMAKIWIIVAVVAGIIVNVIAYAFVGVISEMGYYYYY